MTDSWTYLQPPEDSVCACVCMYEHMHVLVYMCMYMHVGNVGVSFGTRCREEDISIGWMSPVSWTHNLNCYPRQGILYPIYK